MDLEMGVKGREERKLWRERGVGKVRVRQGKEERTAVVAEELMGKE